MRIPVVFLSFVLLSFNACGQSIADIESGILSRYSNIQKWSAYGRGYIAGADDSLEHNNKVLQNYLKETLTRYPGTIKATFEKIHKSEMRITTSDNGKVRIYDWDCLCGGTMHIFNSILQYKTDSGMRVKVLYPLDSEFTDAEWNGPGFFYRHIANVRSKSGKTFYMAIKVGIYSSALHSVGVKCFTIENGLINDSIKIIKTKNGLLNSIDVEVDYTELKSIKKEPEVHFSDDNRKLYIPLIKDNIATGKFLVYVFDGNNFVYDRNAK